MNNNAMNDNDYIKEGFTNTALFHHRFWLQIMGDHGRSIHDALSSDEREKIKMADYFIQLFDELLEQSRKQLSDEQVYELTKHAYAFAEEIRKFKLDLIRDHLAGMIKIDLPPTSINHMVNEVEEYLRVLKNLLEMKLPYETENPS